MSLKIISITNELTFNMKRKKYTLSLSSFSANLCLEVCHCIQCNGQKIQRFETKERKNE